MESQEHLQDSVEARSLKDPDEAPNLPTQHHQDTYELIWIPVLLASETEQMFAECAGLDL